ncbi:hypothetical protein ACTXT7_000328 [Hymenolepis weldensis]
MAELFSSYIVVSKIIVEKVGCTTSNIKFTEERCVERNDLYKSPVAIGSSLSKRPSCLEIFGVYYNLKIPKFITALLRAESAEISPNKKNVMIRYYCDVCLDRTLYARSTSKQSTGNSIFWAEEFDLKTKSKLEKNAEMQKR